MVGYELNVCSWKVSYSLWFFKEGFLEEKVKWKEIWFFIYWEKIGDIVYEGEGLFKEGDVNKIKICDFDDKIYMVKGLLWVKMILVGLCMFDVVEIIEEVLEDYFVFKYMEILFYVSFVKLVKLFCKFVVYD